MEQGKLRRDTFMAEIAAMTERMVKKAKEYDRDTIPGEYATLQTPCQNCGGLVRENYRRFSCIGKAQAPTEATEAAGATVAGTDEAGCGFSFGKSPAGRTFELQEVEQFLQNKKIGPLEGFRSKAGWPFTAEIALKFDEETKNYKLEFDFGDDKAGEEGGELIDFSAQESLGACPKCGSAVYEQGKSYVCEKSVPTADQATPNCDFKSGQIILQQPIVREQMHKLLTAGKTDLLDKFVSMRTRRAFKAMLVWDATAGKVNFEFAPSKFPPKAGAAARPAAKTTAAAKAPVAAKKTPAKKAASKTAATKTAKPKTAAGAAAGKQPSAALAAVIGSEPVARTQVIKKLWDYIKANKLQDATNKRAINADAKLLEVFGKPQVTMFELAGIAGKHLT
jgi:DNA topoisomerase-3